ncbi:hypothetical protein GE09DRAFT_530879 [Coniochaeta sp. 2T2.1]|nr:hypothetical protein GE09DRAFT_530879 [Coniochaeta sp. 2T2.1]
MATSTRAAPLWSSILLAFLLLWARVEAKPSIPMDYCSSINTASMPANHSIYQSDGLCNTFCAPDWAFAIVHSDSCWCSNLQPSKEIQVSTSQCNKPCPGFPDDVCGGDGLYGYMRLNKKPSGTIGTGHSTSSTSTDVATTTVQNTVQNTVTVTPPSRSSTTSSDPSTTTTTSKTTDDNKSQTTETPTVTTLTTGGQTKTVTVTPLPPSATNSISAGGVSVTPTPKKSGLSAGAAAGIAVAVIVAFAFVGGMLAWLFIKRRRAQRAEAAGGPNFSSNRGSSAGMTSSTPKTGEMSETRYYMGGGDRPPPERRRSTLMPVDPRLDPFAKGIYNRAENKSHDSVNTIRDDHDYSRKIQDPPRVLRAVNPDSDID